MSMKVLMLNGSPRPNGNTNVALTQMKETLEQNGIEVEYVHVGNKNVRGCIACNFCKKNGRCVFDDIVNELAMKFEEADGLVVGTPVYYAQPNATLTALMTRLFYSTPFDKSMKVGAAVCCARRSGTTAAFEVLNKFFTISNMPIVSGRYWNNAYGMLPQEALQDEEGLQTMRGLGLNMAFLIKSIDLGKKEFGLPKLDEERKTTNFIR